jgi:RNA polymerase sigma-70 factor, ECF subfamily
MSAHSPTRPMSPSLSDVLPSMPAASFSSAPALRFEDVYRENASFVWRSLRRLGVGEADAEDAVQDVFVVVHGKLSGFEGRSRLSTWLYGICLRVAHARRRRAHVRHELAEDAGAIDDLAAPEASDAAQAREGLELLDEALDALPLEQRAVFTLFELDEMTCQEIAELVDAPLGTVYSRLRLAREAFGRAATRIQARLASPGIVNERRTR